MGPRWARRPEEGSPQASAGIPANTRERARKKANSELLTFVYWWWGASLCQTAFILHNRSVAAQRERLRVQADSAGHRFSYCCSGCTSTAPSTC